jgi:hypothetical protein
MEEVVVGSAGAVRARTTNHRWPATIPVLARNRSMVEDHLSQSPTSVHLLSSFGSIRTTCKDRPNQLPI